MPIVLDEAEQPFNPLATVGKPEGLIVTRDQFSPPVSDGGRPWADTFGEKGTPSFGETLRSSFEQENWLIGPLLKPAEDRDFGPEDREHNPWDAIKGTKYQDHWQSFVSSRNAAETEAIRARIERELENRRLREASGVTGFVTDIIAGMTDPFVLLPGGALYKGFGAANRVKSALSVGASAAGSVALSELALHQQQYTRTWQESMFNIGGATVLGGLLGGGASYFGSRALARASRAIDNDLTRIRTETADIASMTARSDPQAAGAAPARIVADNLVEGAYGVERAFSWQSPLTRVLANEIRAARDVMTRLAEVPFRLRQNAEGIATGPAGGSVEARIKVDGDVAMYRASEALHKAFAEYRYGNPDAKFAKSKAAFADVLKPEQGRLGWREFKTEITKALRSQTDKGIEHPNPHVKAAAESFRRDVFEPFKKEAQKLGLFPEDAEFSFNYVMRRYDVNAILNDYARFKQILVDHLKGGQARARAELAAVEREIAAARTEDDQAAQDVEALRQQFETERARLAVDQGTVDSVMDMWRVVVKEKPKKPLSLSEWVKKEGGIKDDGRALEHMLGGKKEAGRLIAARGMELDTAGLRAFEAGYFPERPTINQLLDALDDDVRSGGKSHFSELDAEALETWRIAEDARQELEGYGIASVTSAKQAEKIVRQMLREESAAPAAKAAREGIDADREFLDELTKMDAPDAESRAAIDEARAETEARIADAEQSIKRMGEDDEPLFAGGAPASMVQRMVQGGRSYVVSEGAIARQLAGVEPFMGVLPEGSRFGVWARVAPSKSRLDFASVTFRTIDGDIGRDIPISAITGSRAMYFGSHDLIVPGRIGDELEGGTVASGVYHEVVHAFWPRLATIDRVRLASHAAKLQILNMQFGTFLRIIGHPSWKNADPADTLLDRYKIGYAGRKNIQELLDQEAVAHMQELHYAGHFTDEQVAPVLDMLMNMRGGDRVLSDSQPVWYHGTTKQFDQFDIAKASSDHGVPVVWMTPSRTQAEQFTVPLPGQAPGRVMSAHVDVGRQLSVEINGKFHGDRFSEILSKAQTEGYDSVLFRNVVDEGGVAADQLAVFDPARIQTLDRPRFAAGAPEPPRIELDPAVISAVEGMAARLGIQMPDLRGLDLDGMMAAVAKSISDMTGMGKAAGNTADLKALHAKADELRFIADATDQELGSIAADTISTITGSPAARGTNPYSAELLQGRSGPLKARTLKIPDEKIVDFLDDDIERIALQYVRAMAPDVALAREFGDINLTEDLKRIQDEANNAAAANPERAAEIMAASNKAQRDIQAVAARLRGTLNIAHDPTSLGPRAAQVVKQGNVLRLMGAVLAASISDVPKLLFVHGFRQNADLFGTLISHLDGLKMAKAEAKELSAGLEFVLSRSGQMWDAFEDMAGHTFGERALRVATNKFGRLTLMDQWNSTWKQLSGIMTMNRVLRHSVDLMNGRLNPKDLGKLAASGIDEAVAERIAAQYQKYGTVYGRLFLANANEWDDPLARQALAAAVRREADITITTPGQERPLWTSGTYGSVVGQFRTFQMVSIQRTLIAGLQEMDAAKVSAIAGMIALGMLSEQLKMIIHGKENKPGKPKDLGDWMYVGLANSGVLGWLTDADQMAHKVSRGNISIGKFAFGKDQPISRFASQNAVGALLGPTYGAGSDIIQAMGAAAAGEIKESDIHAMRRLLPYQNLFYISRALREFEEGMIDAAGVPRTQRRN